MLGKVDSRSFVLTVILTAAGLFSLASRASAQGCQTISGIAYGTYVDGSGATQSLLLELMVPTAAPAPVPLVIWVHGGGWSSGSRLPVPSNVSALCDRGFAVASIDYRFTNVARWPAQIQDCKGAVRWLRAHAAEYGMDPGRFGVWGASAGGQLVSMLGTSGGVATEILGNAQVDLEGTVGGNGGVSSRVQAVVDWYGAIDFLQMRYFPTPSAPNHDASNSAESKLIGGPVQDNPELSATASPLTYVTPDDPPFLVMHGTNDTLYPFHQSRLLVDALAAQGVPVTFTPVPNGGHGGSSWNPAWISQTVWDFFAQTLTAPVAPLREQAATPKSQAPQQLAGQPAVSVQATDAKGAEVSGTTPVNNGQFRISLSTPLVSNLTVAYHTAGTATGGADYVSLPGTATIPAGQTSVTVDLQVINDTQLETGEYVILALDPSSAYQLGTPAEASVAIADDDDDTAKPIVSAIATDFSATEPGAGADTGEFAITRTGGTSAALTVSLLTDGSAVDGTDYTGIPATVTFNAGVSRLTVILTPQDDLANEGTENAELTVAAASGIYLGRFEGNAVALLDDEPLLGTLALSSLSISPAAAPGGGAKPTGTVVLDGPAPAGGVSVALASSDPAASVPASVTVPAGAGSAAFSITTQVVAADRPVTVSATFRTATKTASLTVQAPVLSSLSLTPASFVGGCQTSTGKVTLTGKAPAGGIVVSLTNGNPAAALPASVTVAAGATSATFAITAPAVTSSQAGTVTATQGGVTKNSTLTVRPVGLAALALAPNPVTGPAPVTGTVTLECAAAPGPVTVTVTTTSTVAQPTPSFTIPAGQTAGTFNVTTTQVSAVSKATIKATANGTSKSVTLTVNP
jgi:acetyl esterase/lipase